MYLWTHSTLSYFYFLYSLDGIHLLHVLRIMVMNLFAELKYGFTGALFQFTDRRGTVYDFAGTGHWSESV